MIQKYSLKLSRLLLLVAIPCLSFCKEEDQTPQVEDSAAWKTLNADGISIALPENWQYQRKQGIDSHVGLFTNTHDSLVFDLGWYSNPLNVDPGKYAITQERINGRPGKIIKSTLPAEIPYGVYIDSVAFGPSGTKSTFSMEQTSAAVMDENKILRIFRSLKF